MLKTWEHRMGCFVYQKMGISIMIAICIIMGPSMRALDHSYFLFGLFETNLDSLNCLCEPKKKPLRLVVGVVIVYEL